VGHRVVFGKSEDALSHALDVLDGKADRLKDEKLLLPKESGDLVVAEGCLRKFDLGQNNPASAVFQSSKTVRFQLAEAGEKVGAKVSFQTKDDDAATQVAAMINGLLALVRIQKDNGDQNLIKLANAIEVKQDGTTVTLSLSEPSADLVQMIKKGSEEKKHKEEAQDTNAPATKP
jgi:RNA processing factor Prp31